MPNTADVAWPYSASATRALRVEDRRVGHAADPDVTRAVPADRFHGMTPGKCPAQPPQGGSAAACRAGGAARLGATGKQAEGRGATFVPATARLLPHHPRAAP